MSDSAPSEGRQPDGGIVFGPMLGDSCLPATTTAGGSTTTGDESVACIHGHAALSRGALVDFLQRVRPECAVRMAGAQLVIDDVTYNVVMENTSIEAVTTADVVPARITIIVANTSIIRQISRKDYVLLYYERYANGQLELIERNDNGNYTTTYYEESYPTRIKTIRDSVTTITHYFPKCSCGEAHVECEMVMQGDTDCTVRTYAERGTTTFANWRDTHGVMTSSYNYKRPAGSPRMHKSRVELGPEWIMHGDCVDYGVDFTETRSYIDGVLHRTVKTCMNKAGIHKTVTNLNVIAK